MKPFRIGSGAGYSGDRIDPAQDLAERGALDVLVFECLADVGTVEGAQASVDRCVEQFGGIDILVNNAAKQIFVEDPAKLSSQQFQQTFRVNVFAMFWNKFHK